MNHFLHCCSFSTSNKITSKGCQSASKTCDLDAKNAKFFWGGGTAPSRDPSPSSAYATVFEIFEVNMFDTIGKPIYLLPEVAVKLS